MNTIKVYLLSILSFFYISVFSQFSLKTELKYLQIVNNQENKDLILGNIINAEFLVDSLVLSNHQSITKSRFLVELSRSYYLLKKYDLALFTLLRQRCLFPNAIVEKQSKNLFEESIFSNNISDSISKIIVDKTTFSHIPNKLSDKFNLLLKLLSDINTKDLSYPIYKLGLVYRSIESNIPLWYQHWEYLSIINLKPKNIKQVMPYAINSEPIYRQTSNKKLKYKIYRKSIKHYRKHHAYKNANDLLKEYKTHKLNLFLKIDALYKLLSLKIVQQLN